jgi:Tfp pilus assembly protein PilF
LFAAPLAAAEPAAPLAPQRALVHHPITTTTPAAQTLFDEGLTLVYAFNRQEARARFEAASKADPSSAMAWWGVALAVGPNINVPMSPDDIKVALAAIGKARALESGASPRERAYVEALAMRYSDTGVDPKNGHGAIPYRIAMAKLSADDPSDSDGATLYAESMLDADDWGWQNGKPTGSTQTLETTLEGVLARDPSHIGANHYLVHVLDFPTIAAGAQKSADRLAALPIEPAASHLVHMSGHAYLDLGEFAPLLAANRIAVDDDRAFAQSRNEAVTALDYYGHNLDFYLGSAVMLDDTAEISRALGFAAELKSYRVPLAEARLRRWRDVLASADAVTSKSPFARMTVAYARGLALLATGDRAGAGRARASITGGDESYTQRYADVLGRLLDARLAHADGDDARAANLLRGAIADTADLPPETVAPWYYPMGEWLGTTLLASGDPVGAEAAFRADLVRTPHNPRALYGLMQALSRQGRIAEGRAYADEIAANWHGPASELRLDF